MSIGKWPNPSEQWPKLADSTEFCLGTVYIYADTAMFEPDIDRASFNGPEESNEVWLDESKCREVEEVFEWVRKRLLSRKST